MTSRCNRVFVCAAVMTLCAAAALTASDPDTAGMLRVFDGMERAIKAGDRNGFMYFVHPRGIRDDLVGDSGFSGEELFRQARAGHWFLKPRMAEMRDEDRGGLFVIPCDIIYFGTNRSAVRVFALPVYLHERKTWVLLGVGKNIDRVFALARRYRENKALKP